jgi:hypothetical protein
MRRLASAVAVAALVASGAAEARSPHREQLRVTPRDGGLAQRIVLTQGDLGGGWAAVDPGPWNDDATCATFDPDLSAYTITGRAHSAVRDAAGTTVVSAVELHPTAADAAADFRASNTAEVPTCVASFFQEGVQKQGLTMRIRAARMVRAPRVGDQASRYAYRFELQAAGRSLGIYMDTLAFRRGRAVVAVLVSGRGESAGNVVAIARKLAARVSV